MNAGVLNFTLGLGAGGFLTTIGQAESKVKGLVGTMLKLPGIGTAVAGVAAAVGTLGGLVGGVFEAFEKGAELEHLSKRVGEPVKALFMLEKGFKAAGLSAEDVGPALFQMQRALGGVNEMGESTADIFLRMGLQIGQLKKLDAVGQFASITKALAKMSQTDAAKAASMIFGRQEGANMIQLARSSGEFGDAMKRATGQAEVFARNAERFERIERSLAGFKSSVNGLFLGIAEGAAPGVQRLLDALNSIDFSTIGRKFGEVLQVMAQSIKDKEFGKLIELSLNAGFESAGNFAIATIWGINAAMEKAFENLNKPKVSQEGTGAAKDWGMVGRRAGEGALIGLEGAADQIGVWFDKFFHLDPTASQNLLKQRTAELDQTIKELDDALGIAAPATKNFFEGTLDGTKEAFKASFVERMAKGSADAGDALKRFYGRELQRSPKASESGAGKGQSGKTELNLAPKVESSYKPDFTAFEKMGFVMSGIGNPLTEHARTTAFNTSRLVQQMDKLIAREPETGSDRVINQPL